MINVLIKAGIVGDCLVDSYVLPAYLMGAVYRDFISNTLPDLLEDVPLLIRRSMWFMHDGAPAHFTHIFRYAPADVHRES